MSQGLQRLRLQWLPVLVALVVGAVRRGREASGQLWPVVRTYGELAGKDRHVAQAEVLRMTAQLRPLASRLPMSGELARPVSRAEFGLAADALLRFYVAGRHTDDPLLKATQAAAYAEVEAIAEAMLDRAHGQDRSTWRSTGSGRLRRTAVMSGCGYAGWTTNPVDPLPAIHGMPWRTHCSEPSPLGTAVVPCCPLLHAPDMPQGRLWVMSTLTPVPLGAARSLCIPIELGH
jgi:hypothetical protein